MTLLPPAETSGKSLLSVKNRHRLFKVFFAKMSERLVFDGERNNYTEI